MSRARFVLLGVVLIVGLGVFAWASVSRRDGAMGTGPRRATLDSPFALTGLDTDKGIRQFERRVTEDARDFISLTILGQLYARKAREGSDLTWLRRAEQAFRHALNLKPDHTPASIQLAAAYISQHRFAEGLVLAQEVYERSPDSLEVLAILFDGYLETGRYSDAEEAIATLEKRAGNDSAVLARRAAMAEIKGRTAQAVALLERAVSILTEQADAPAEIAWFNARLGDIYYHAGCLPEAEQSFQTALDLVHTYPIGLAGLADVRAVQGRLDEAIGLYQKSVADTPTPHRLFLLASLEERANRTADAKRHREQAEAIARREGGHPAAYYRDLALYYADQVGRSSEALEYAKKDLAVRQDVRAYDTLAWALYRSRRLEEAAAASAEALKLGTRDADFFYHAGMIYEALGDAVRARSAFDQALQLRPRAPDGTRSADACRLHS